jgi:hypothetical protein
MPPPEGQSVPTQGHGGDEPSETGTILRRILEGMEATVGEQFFPSLVQQLATSRRRSKPVSRMKTLKISTPAQTHRNDSP